MTDRDYAEIQARHDEATEWLTRHFALGRFRQANADRGALLADVRRLREALQDARVCMTSEQCGHYGPRGGGECVDAIDAALGPEGAR